MAVTSFETQTASASFIARIGTAIVDSMVKFAEASSRYKAIEKINALSDETIAEMGATRAELVRDAIGAHY